MYTPVTLQDLDNARQDVESLEVVVNGDENTDVTTRLGETYPTLSKLINDSETLVQSSIDSVIDGNMITDSLVSVGGGETQADKNAEFKLDKFDTGITVTAPTGGEDISLAALNSLVITPERFGARMSPDQDDAPAFRKAIAYLESIGGGVLSLNAVKYNLKSVVERTGYFSTSASAGVLVPVTVKAPFFVPAKVSLVGAGRDQTILDCTTIDPSNISHGISLVEYSDGVISGFSLLGTGMSGSSHGIHLSLLTSSKNHTNKNIRFSDLRIKDWSAYGIGHQYGAPYNVTLDNILVENAGSDCIDFKVRFGGEPSQDIAAGVIMNNIIARNPSSKGTHNASGIGVRGRAILSNIEVTGVPDTAEGITLTAAIGIADEFRQPSYKSSLTNFYVESKDPRKETIGLSLFSNGPVVVSNGFLKGCCVASKAPTESPTYHIHGGSLNNITVDGHLASNSSSFQINLERTHMFGCRSVSQVDYFESRRNNLVEGQTELEIGRGYDESVVVFKNHVELVSTSDYHISNNKIVLSTAAELDDKFHIITPSHRFARITENYCSIIGGGADRWHKEFNGILATEEIKSTTMTQGVFFEGLSNVVELLSPAAILQAISDKDDEDLRLTPKGLGVVRIHTESQETSDVPITRYMSIKDASGQTRKVALID